MSKIKVTRIIQAPVELVFKTISDIRIFSKAVPEIVDIEFLSDKETGVGTRFKEIREFRGKEMSTVLEITELKEDELIRIVSDSQRTVWDSIFKVRERESITDLTLVMEARPYKFSARLMNLFIKRFIKKAVEKDMDAVKKHCEKRAF